MVTNIAKPFLPPDLILYVVDFVVPPLIDTKVAYEHEHVITRTLLALTLTSRLIYPVARRLPYNHCLYIDSPYRLHALLDSLSAYSPGSFALRPPLTPFSAHIHPTSLYLSPYVETIPSADYRTEESISDLLSLIAPSLRRLVIDMPLRRLVVEMPLRHLFFEMHSLHVRQLLHNAFAKLTSLELFCSARDDLFLVSAVEQSIFAQEPRVLSPWSCWRKLKTLALYNIDLSSAAFWHDLVAMDNLQTLVLTRADSVQEVDFRNKWIECGNGHKSLTVWFVDIDGGRGIPERIEESKEGDKVTIKIGRVPTSYYGDEDEIELCQDWIKRSALRGEDGFQKELRNLSTSASETE
jgi:hypothetical protein